MRHGKIMVCLFTAAFLAVAVFWGVKASQWDGTVSLSVVVSSGAETEEISCWRNEDGEYYVFLPSYADLTQIQIRTNTRCEVSLDGRLLADGISCGNIQLDIPYDLTYTYRGSTYHFSLTFVHSANVPAMYIDVVSGSMDYIHEKRGNEEPGTLRLYTADGELDHRGNLEFIKGRGNTTWYYADKKPYNLRLSVQADLLGMGQAENWVLLANAYDDESQLKNKIVYDFARNLGLAYTPECQWVDLYLNGEYAGLYLLCEKNEVHPERVAIGENGSFLVSKEWEQQLIEKNLPYISTASHAALRIHYSALDVNTLTRMWQSAENAILAEDGIDPVTGKHWQELIDLDSWAKKYLLEEVFGNIDAGFASQFFYYDGSGEDGKIFAGPIWDYDDIMGTPTWSLVHRPYAIPGENTLWFYTLYQKEAFHERVVQLYQTDFLPLLTDLLEEGIYRYAGKIDLAAKMNQKRWDTGDLAAAAEYTQAYMTERIGFFNSLWIDNEPYCLVMVTTTEGVHSYCYAVPPGRYLPDLSLGLQDMEVIGWYTMDTDEPFDITQPIYEDVEIYLKYAGAVEDTEETEPSFVDFMLILIFILLFVSVGAVGWKREKQMSRGNAKRNGTQKNERTNCKIPS